MIRWTVDKMTWGSPEGIPMYAVIMPAPQISIDLKVIEAMDVVECLEHDNNTCTPPMSQKRYEWLLLDLEHRE